MTFNNNLEIFNIVDINYIIINYVDDLNKWDEMKKRYKKMYLKTYVSKYGFYSYEHMFGDELLFSLYMDKYKYHVNYHIITSEHKLKEFHIEYLIDNYEDLKIRYYNKMTKKHVLNNILKHQNLSERLLIKLVRINELNNRRWHYISVHQNLSEEFIYKYRNKLDWYHINKRYNLSNKEEMKYYINYMSLKCYRNKFY